MSNRISANDPLNLFTQDFYANDGVVEGEETATETTAATSGTTATETASAEAAPTATPAPRRRPSLPAKLDDAFGDPIRNFSIGTSADFQSGEWFKQLAPNLNFGADGFVPLKSDESQERFGWNYKLNIQPGQGMDLGTGGRFLIPRGQGGTGLTQDIVMAVNGGINVPFTEDPIITPVLGASITLPGREGVNPLTDAIPLFQTRANFPRGLGQVSTGFTVNPYLNADHSALLMLSSDYSFGSAVDGALNFKPITPMPGEADPTAGAEFLPANHKVSGSVALHTLLNRSHNEGVPTGNLVFDVRLGGSYSRLVNPMYSLPYQLSEGDAGYVHASNWDPLQYRMYRQDQVSGPGFSIHGEFGLTQLTPEETTLGSSVQGDRLKRGVLEMNQVWSAAIFGGYDRSTGLGNWDSGVEEIGVERERLPQITETIRAGVKFTGSRILNGLFQIPEAKMNLGKYGTFNVSVPVGVEFSRTDVTEGGITTPGTFRPQFAAGLEIALIFSPDKKDE